jgi:hypothetical protein
MVMRTQGNEVNMKMKGKKVGGDCDANELKRKVAGMQKQADESRAQIAESQAKTCEKGAAEVTLELFVSPFPGVPVQCKDPSKLCANLETRPGLVALRQHGGKDGREKATKLCKKDLDAVVEKLCAAAKKDQEKATKLGDEETMEFVFGHCPDLGKALAKRECAGRKFTALPQAQRDFCTRWAQQKLEASEETPRERSKAAAGKYLPSGIPAPDADEAPVKKDKKKPAAEDEDEAAAKPKDAGDMKSRIMKGIFGR